VSARLRVLKSDPYHSVGEADLEFRLTYEGRLYGASKGDTRAKHKHEIRKAFHRQLAVLWSSHPFLKGGHEVSFSHGMRPFIGIYNNETLIESVSKRFERCGYSFVPLVREDLSLLCSVEILFLRPDRPGGLLRSADIDNRLKTLFDALRLPKDRNELGGFASPDANETPFFCLLEDDSLITHVSVETDLLLQPIQEQQDPNDAKLVITVRIRPYDMHVGNLNYG
jgi:hypothetical protein